LRKVPELSGSSRGQGHSCPWARLAFAVKGQECPFPLISMQVKAIRIPFYRN
jgi:hypothetical protein